MRFLLCNDDGYFAPGLAALADTLAHYGEFTVVAPERDMSGASHSLTLDRPLKVRRAANDFYTVNGTPTDCVHLAVTGILDARPDMVISGINHGDNLGDDTLYSGTVAAATEGFLLGLPSLAVSLTGDAVHLDTARLALTDFLDRWLGQPLSGPCLLSLNVPDVPREQYRGIKVTRLGRRHESGPALCSLDPRGETVYWVGPAGAAQDTGEGSDFHAVAQGYASLTPLTVDLTAHSQLATVEQWLHR
ncbi:5'/3'-nucleotidase SurE [Crenobacter cavernae]|uniref:5'-nucleotidase SurE n=1 Tax=Crenobacter cavernae TaxID=2290923 RepID=A0ABY0FF23_9NEIS|nr:5'/3'-nucleotidase SurE [Crenobacter cavernae]RXZ44906.1 5'/3'-nucleotidase SurE [Crenobacter cavernae]